MAPVVVIDTADDERVSAFRLNERGLNPRPNRRDASTAAGLFVAEGDLVAERALTAGCLPVAVLCSPAASESWAERLPHDATVLVAEESVRSVVTGLGVALEVVGLFRRPSLPSATEVIGSARRIVVVDRIDNPTNVGAIVRSAAALGADALLLDRTSADPLTRRALRVAMGTAFVLRTARVDDADAALAVLHRAGARTVALTPDPSAPTLAQVRTALEATDAPVALLLGSERTGLEPSTLGSSTHRARIPMAHGVDSLNVAAAAAVACYALF